MRFEKKCQKYPFKKVKQIIKQGMGQYVMGVGNFRNNTKRQYILTNRHILKTLSLLFECCDELDIVWEFGFMSIKFPEFNGDFNRNVYDFTFSVKHGSMKNGKARPIFKTIKDVNKKNMMEFLLDLIQDEKDIDSDGYKRYKRWNRRKIIEQINDRIKVSEIRQNR